MNKIRTILVGTLLSVLVVVGSFAASPAAVPRKIIAFYNPGLAGARLHQAPVHQHLEVALNHLGYDVVNRSIADPLPSDADMNGVAAVVSWFFENGAVPDSENYCRWVARWMDQGVKWVSLNKTGLLPVGGGDLSPACTSLFRKLGADFRGEQTEDPLFISVVSQNPDMVAFERPLSLADEISYVFVKAMASDLKCHLTLSRADLDDSDSCVVFTSPRGGFAAATFVTQEDRDLQQERWRLNPFRFFREILGTTMPAPDVTTINGSRLFMSHIDGDGIFNLSQIDRVSYAGEVISRDILKARPTMPISVSLITGYFDIPEYSGERSETLYREMFTLPNVEAAVHGYAHPLLWDKKTVSLEIPGYVPDMRFEIVGATAKMRDLLTRLAIGKNTSSYFWTGNCLPDEALLAVADESGLLAINGGDSRYDKGKPSYSYLRPIGLRRGNRIQIYSSFGNENVFTNLWRGPYYGYRDAMDSFRNTESPLRIKPIDVYYHFYSGERAASLIALKQTYDDALSGDVFPVFLSRYVRIARDFYATTLLRLPGGGWRVQTGGHLRTVRFDGESRFVDMARSRGVLGFLHYQNSLYVHLSEAPDHEVRLSVTPPKHPYVSLATFDVSDWHDGGRSLSFVKNGWWRGRLILGGMVARRSYRVTELRSDGTTTLQTLAVGADGVLNVAFESAENGKGPSRVTIELF